MCRSLDIKEHHYSVDTIQTKQCTTRGDLLKMSASFLLILTLLSIFVSYYYWSRRRLYAAAAKLQGPRGLPFIGNALQFWGNSEDILYKISSVFKIVDDDPLRFWLGPFLLIGLKNPVHLEKIMSSQKFAHKHDLYKILQTFLGDGLITATGGAKYRLHRKTIQPFLDLKFSEQSIGIMQEHINLCMNILHSHVDKGTFDIQDIILKCSMDMIGEIIMGQKLDTQKHGFNSFCQGLVDMYDVAFSRLVKIWQQPDFIFNFLSAKSTQTRITNSFQAFGQEALIDSWKRRKLLYRKKDDFVPIIDKLTEFVEYNPSVINNEDMINHLVTLFAASDDTLAIISSFTALCFGMYPEYQKRAAEEVRNILGDKMRKISLEDIYKMEYLDMCIKDVLRLFPIGAYILRKTQEDFVLDKWTIPRGACIVVPIYDLHRDEKYWDNPHHFHPDHFLPEAVRKRHVYAYLPFSAGPRGCIGKTLANVGLKLIISNLLLNYEIEADGKVPDIELKSDISVRPKKGYYCRIKNRQWDGNISDK